MSTKFKKGEKVNFKVGRVSKKYGCKFGFITRVIDIYTDRTLKYPEEEYDLSKENIHLHSLNLSVDAYFGDFYCKGFVINACNSEGVIKEKIIVTEDFVSNNI